MTAAELKDEILNGPLASEMAAAWSAGDDSTIASVLNRKDRAGYVPARKLVGKLAALNLWGLVILASRFRLLPNGSTCPIDLFTLFATCELTAYGTFSPPIQMLITPLQTALDALVSATPALLTSDQRTAILADEVKISRAEELESVVTIEAVAEARKV